MPENRKTGKNLKSMLGIWILNSENMGYAPNFSVKILMPYYQKEVKPPKTQGLSFLWSPEKSQ